MTPDDPGADRRPGLEGRRPEGDPMTDTPAHRRPPAHQHPGARTTLGWTRTRSAAPDCSPTKGGALTRLLDAPFVAALDCDERGPPRWDAQRVIEERARGGPPSCCTLDWI